MHSIVGCHACGSPNTRAFYEVAGIPVHSVLLMPSRDLALAYPRRDLRLDFCDACGFIQNGIFDPGVHEYSTRYEETQGFSPTFNAFARELAGRLVERHDLRGKTVLEIGCGKGEFLALICGLGGNKGVGIDPSYVPGRLPDADVSGIRFIQEFYSESYGGLTGDFICCRHTLEHIQTPRDFVKLIRASIVSPSNPMVFFEVPGVERVLDEHAFWDIYYEHCSYFSLGSLARLFRASGFEVTDLDTGFDDQYLLLEARPGDGAVRGQHFEREDDLDALRAAVGRFHRGYRATLARWTTLLDRARDEGRRAVIWGAGSKGVAFLTTLGITDQIALAVDINPHKQGQFMPGSGHEVVSPQAMKDLRPDLVLAMNPIYRDEIARDLRGMNVEAELIVVR